MIVTLHESASAPIFLGDYHVEMFAKKTLPQSLVDECYNALVAGSMKPSYVEAVRTYFSIKKFIVFGTPTSYGTFEMNHDPRDRSTNIEIAAMCMGGEGVKIAGPWGRYPYTAAHGVMHAAISARVCKLKALDPTEIFDPSVDPNVLQNGPISVLATHGERAIQTYETPGPDSATTETLARRFGYFAYSGDPDCRWDVAALDPRDADKLGSAESARTTCIESAHRLRALTRSFMDAGITDFWGLDAAP